MWHQTRVLYVEQVPLFSLTGQLSLSLDEETYFA
jgi:hypothetical protein